MATRGASSASPVTERQALRWQGAIIKRIAPQTPRIKSFWFMLSSPFGFLAGQHVNVRLTAPDGYGAERSYSIASSPEGQDTIELAIERLDDGEVSPFFHDAAQVGDDIELRGPIGGHFIWRPSDSTPVLLIGGGSGVVPLVSMARHRAAQKAAAPMLLLVSARTWDDFAFRDELLALHQRRDGFELVVSLTRDAARRDGDFARRIDSALIAKVIARLPGAPAQVFVCGSNKFVEAAARGTIDAGITAHLIRTERYGS
jgi:ferredoxin-NADP reductase